MKVLVTGATGFIGKKLLSEIKGDIRILSRVKHDKYPTVICDFEKDIIPVNSLTDVDIVFHLAGVAHDTSIAKELYQKINVDATVQLAELSVQSNVKKFIFVSSVKAGGASDFARCTNEDDQGNPKGVYGNTKREAEIKLLEIGLESGMHVSIIRPSLVYGPNVKGNLKLMLSGVKHGWFPPLPKTNNKRSMIHVDDLVRAILLVSENDNAKGEIYIATDGISYTSREIYDVMCIFAGRSVPKWSVPKFVFDVLSLVSQNFRYKINKLIGNECYSSDKLKKIGFRAQKTLKDMCETSF